MSQDCCNEAPATLSACAFVRRTAVSIGLAMLLLTRIAPAQNEDPPQETIKGG